MPKEPIFWSDATFALWQRITALAGGDVKDIRYIAQGLVYNDITASIIDSAVPEGSSAKITVFGPGDEAFRTLLGTPNGWGGVFLLMEHKRVLGFKTISRVALIRDGSQNDPFLIFGVVDMPAPRSCRGVASSNITPGNFDTGAALNSSKLDTS